jgi:hypothetical protein
MSRCICFVFVLLVLATSARGQALDYSRFHFLHVIVSGAQIRSDTYRNNNNPTIYIAPLQIDETFDSLSWDSISYSKQYYYSKESPPNQGSQAMLTSLSYWHSITGNMGSSNSCRIHLEDHNKYTSSGAPSSESDYNQDIDVSSLKVLIRDSNRLVVGSDDAKSLSYSASESHFQYYYLMHHITSFDTTVSTNPVSIRLYFCTDRSADTVRISADVNWSGNSTSPLIFEPTIADRLISLNIDSGKLDIFDALGKPVYFVPAMVQGKTTIDTHSWPNGTYFVVCTSDRQTQTSKFVVRH